MSPRIGRMVGPPETTITADATPRPVASSEAGRFHWLALATGPDGKSTALEGKTMKSLKRTKIADLNNQLDTLGAWMRAHGRSNVERAKQVSSQMSNIRGEIARRSA